MGKKTHTVSKAEQKKDAFDRVHALRDLKQEGIRTISDLVEQSQQAAFERQTQMMDRLDGYIREMNDGQR